MHLSLLEQMHRVNANVLSIVLNDMATRGSYYSYQYRYYRNYIAYQGYYGESTREHPRRNDKLDDPHAQRSILNNRTALLSHRRNDEFQTD